MKKTLSLFLLLILTLSLLFMLPSCDEPGTDGSLTLPKPKTHVLDGYYFDTACVFKDYSGATDERSTELFHMIEDEVALCHKLYDIYNEYDGITNLKTLNDAAGGDAVQVDGRIIELIKYAKEMYTLTEGNVNIAMGSVLRLWHDCRAEANRPGGTARIPDMDELRAVSLHTDLDDVVIDEAASTVRILDPDLSLDVGAIAKGHTVERVAKMLEAEGVRAYVLDFGGNIRVGEKLDGSAFSSGIENPIPYSSDAYVRKLNIKNCALVTSASTKRVYEVEGVKYHHIINKDTLMPADRYVSVTVKCPSSSMGDALSTGFFNMSEEDIRRTVDTLQGVEVTVVYKTGEVVVID